MQMLDMLSQGQPIGRHYEGKSKSVSKHVLEAAVVGAPPTLDPAPAFAARSALLEPRSFFLWGPVTAPDSQTQPQSVGMYTHVRTMQHATSYVAPSYFAPHAHSPPQIWLLRERCLEELHTFITLVVPAVLTEPPSSLSALPAGTPAAHGPVGGSVRAHVGGGGGSGSGGGSSGGSGGAAMKFVGIAPHAESMPGRVAPPLARSTSSAGLSAAELAYIERMPPPMDAMITGASDGGGGDGAGSTSLKVQMQSHCLLVRLCPYFRGLHSTDEICHQEKLEPQLLQQLLREYPRLLAASTRVLHSA
jgi:hypothetical protein